MSWTKADALCITGGGAWDLTCKTYVKSYIVHELAVGPYMQVVRHMYFGCYVKISLIGNRKGIEEMKIEKPN